MLNFNWWVNRKDPHGKNVFAGGFWGSTTSASSIAARRCRPADHSNRPTVRRGWPSTARTCSRSRSSSPTTTRSTRNTRSPSCEHSCGSPTRWIESATTTTRCGTRTDGFYYDVLRLPDGSAERLKVRSMVGLLPLCATTVFDPAHLSGIRSSCETARAVQRAPPRGGGPDRARRRRFRRIWRPAPALAAVNKERLERILAYMLDENEFLGPYGIRSLSSYHRDQPVHVPRRRTRPRRVTTCLPNPTPACSAATRTGVGRSGCRSTA